MAHASPRQHDVDESVRALELRGAAREGPGVRDEGRGAGGRRAARARLRADVADVARAGARRRGLCAVGVERHRRVPRRRLPFAEVPEDSARGRPLASSGAASDGLAAQRPRVHPRGALVAVGLLRSRGARAVRTPVPCGPASGRQAPGGSRQARTRRRRSPLRELVRRRHRPGHDAPAPAQDRARRAAPDRRLCRRAVAAPAVQEFVVHERPPSGPRSGDPARVSASARRSRCARRPPS